MKRLGIILMGLIVLLVSTNEGHAQHRKPVKPARVSRVKVVYKRPRTKVVAVRTLPHTRRVILHKGTKLYFANNRYYRYYNGRYIVVAPKIGVRLSFLPQGYVNVVFGNRNYYMFQGVYYEKDGDEYEVVYPELGTIIYELPEDYEKVEVDGLTYYESNNVLYEKIQVDGTRAYEVVGIIED
ncbi:MAG: hypothetical protein CMH46_15810 [Muricauda sp.]|nr:MULTISPECIES: DUF6515 family protein [unclassified Allomuricauda]MAU16994.1 hypothetical protein [Allomuricauda sp.]|tara:strand:- start:12323 stop:12868 length:546 start_codon:yes stop_codon:yes gene_type:complete